MSDNDVELLKLQIQREQASRDFWKWAIMYVLLGLTPTLTALTSYIEHRAISSVGEKADTAAVKAETAVEKTKDVASTLTATTQRQDEALTAIAGGVDASVKSWKAYQTKDPEDMSIATEAVIRAESTQLKP